jgi:uncharacterized protein YkwD
MFNKSELEFMEETLHNVALQIDKDLQNAENMSHTSMVTLENLWQRLTDLACKAGGLASEV